MKKRITKQQKNIQSLHLADVENTEFRIQPMAPFVKQNRDWLHNALRTDAYMMFWFHNTATRIQVDQEEIAITKDTILFIGKDRVHILMDEQYDGTAICFTEQFFCVTPDDADFLNNSPLFNRLQPLQYIKVTAEDKVFPMLVTMLELENAPENGATSRIVTRNLLQHFIIAAERKLKDTVAPAVISKDSQQLNAFRQLLDRDYRSVKSVAAYAARLHLTEKRLHAATTALLDKSPKQVIDEKVMLEARRLLIYSSKTTSEISFELGFLQVSNFIKYFRKHADLTPAAYRKAALLEA
ncbi:helix-turn-helix domain-containing protein [Chitinophaga qingshengii]|uniref:AraC family transcriptional regulator n=1 Tax=Chitinophaga qingshengii TaxID=1569794 RepID=A0ABR7TWZ9_9BACT|nr:helix-turn-helix domain-containing protein [Chitinophaga qingshengii]MBC9934952.1 AraC family transcriptional regulator [Chitinophaga qingshengii]